MVKYPRLAAKAILACAPQMESTEKKRHCAKLSNFMGQLLISTNTSHCVCLGLNTIFIMFEMPSISLNPKAAAKY